MYNSESLTKAMARKFGVLPANLEPIIRTAPLRYKVFEIPKRDGSPRIVAQPAREVKALQRFLIDELSPFLPIHQAAMAYRDGLSIRDNANRHKDHPFLLKMDLKNFFPSIQATDILMHLTAHASGYGDESALKMVTRICTWAHLRKPPLRLCIGAPSSPLISNSIMYAFDEIIFDYCVGSQVTYTRYADDLIFSSWKRSKLGPIPKLVKTALDELPFPHLQINSKKTVYAARGDAQVVTGVVIKPDGEISAGRERKRLARAMYYRFKSGQLSDKEQEKMWGLISFIDYLEPGYSLRLKSG